MERINIQCSNVKDNLLVFKDSTRNIKGFYDLVSFERFETISLFLEASEMGHPPQPPDEQVLQAPSGFFLENKGFSTKKTATKTISMVTMDCIMVKF
jgi:hypothetical protein